MANAAFDKLAAKGCEIKRDVVIPTYSELSKKVQGNDEDNVIGNVSSECHSFDLASAYRLLENLWRDKFDNWLALCPDAPVGNLKELVAYNEAHAAQAMPVGALAC